MKKTTISIILISIFFIVGCSSAPTVTKFTNDGNNMLGITFSDGSVSSVDVSSFISQLCPKLEKVEPTIIYENITTIKTVEVCNSSIQADLLACQQKTSALLTDYVHCEANKNEAISSANGTCTEDLIDCTDTAIDYTNRLNNITRYTSNFYVHNPGQDADCNNQLYACNQTVLDCVNRIINITWYASANR